MFDNAVVGVKDLDLRTADIPCGWPGRSLQVRAI
jgi:hypothetical protein